MLADSANRAEARTPARSLSTLHSYAAPMPRRNIRNCRDERRCFQVTRFCPLQAGWSALAEAPGAWRLTEGTRAVQARTC